jgi:SAM-dependent methyltransferase
MITGNAIVNTNRTIVEESLSQLSENNSVDVTQFYDGQYTERQKKKSGLNVNRYLPYILPYFSETDTVLDFGCGIGELLNNLPGAKKVGIEVNPASREYGRETGLEVYASPQELPDVLTFSRIVSTHALEHTLSPSTVLQQLRPHLIADGLLILVLPLDDWRAKSQARWSHDDVHKHLYAWTPNTIGNLLIASGYAPQEISVLNRAHPPRFSKQLLQTGLYQFAGWGTAVLLKRRQLIAIASRAE